MRILFVTLALVAVGLTGCFEEAAPGGETTSSTTTTQTTGTTSETTTTTTAEPPAPCRAWIETHFANAAGGSNNRHAQWRITIGAENASVAGATLTVKIEQVNSNGDVTGTVDDERQEDTLTDGEATFSHRPPLGVGRFRLTVLDIEQTAGGDDCEWDRSLDQDDAAKEVSVF